MRKVNFLGMFIIALFLCSTFIVYADDSLNGTWVSIDDNYEMSLDNGAFEFILTYNTFTVLEGNITRRISTLKGTYSIKSERLIFNITHIFGDFWKIILFDEYKGEPYLELYRADSRWYTIDEFITTYISRFMEIGHNENEANRIAVMWANDLYYWLPPPSSYSVEGSSLILTSSATIVRFAKKYQ